MKGELKGGDFGVHSFANIYMPMLPEEMKG